MAAEQILRVNRPGSEPRIEIDTALFQSILQKALTTKTAIISMCGENDTGKSFMLNFLRRYLENSRENEFDWLDWSNGDSPMSGFPWNRSRNQQATGNHHGGIWVWSEPLYIVAQEGTTTAVFLLDSTVSGDEVIDSLILKLSYKLSAATILNTNPGTIEQYINKLTASVIGDSTNKAVEDSRIRNLICMIRDWQVTGHYLHGMQGGMRFTNNILGSNFKTVEKSIKCRLSCVLFPSPGPVTLPHYNGNINDLDPRFIQILESFAPELCSFEFPTRPIQKQFEIFEKLCIPFVARNPRTRYENKDSSLFYQDFVQNYKTKLAANCDEVNMSGELLQEIHDRISREVISQFRQDPNLNSFGSYSFNREQEDKLTEEITESFQNLMVSRRNLKTQNKERVQTELDQQTLYYDEEMQHCLSVPRITVAVLLSTHRQVINRIRQAFRDSTNGIDPNLISQSLIALEETLELKLANLKQRVQNMVSEQNKKKLESNLKLHLAVYKEKMDAFTSSTLFVQTGKLEQHHKSTSMAITLDMKESCGLLWNEEAQASFKQIIESTFKSIFERNEHARISYQQEMKSLLGVIGNTFKSEIQQMFEQEGSTTEDFNQGFEMHYAKALDTFHVKNTFVSAGEAYLRDLISKLESEFELQKESYEEIQTTRQQNLTRILRDWVESELENISRIMTTSDKFRTESSIQEECQWQIHDALQHIPSQVGFEFLVDDFRKKFVSRVESYTNDIFLPDWRFRQSEKVKHFQDITRQVHATYKELMEKAFATPTTFIKPSDLLSMHKIITEQAIKDHLSTETKDVQLHIESTLITLYDEFKARNDVNTPGDAAIGIDLGTTNTCVAVYHKGKVQVIPSVNGKNTTPSFVAILPDEEVVGEAAKSQAFINPKNTIYDAKRIIGRSFLEVSMKENLGAWSFGVVDEDSKAMIKVKNSLKPFDPERISAKLLTHMAQRAEGYLGQGAKVTKAVITVPAHFNNAQREATKEAGEMAGLEVIKILNEPTAAAIAYNWEHRSEHKRIILVFDLGGGTFDVSILSMTGGDIKVLGVDGDAHLGGEDFDLKIVNHCLEEFQRVNNVNLQDTPEEQAKYHSRFRRLKDKCEDQKRNLTSTHKVSILVDSFYKDINLNVELTRSKFEDINQPEFKKTIEIVNQALTNAKLSKDMVDEVVLAGGSSRIPKVQQLLSEYFGGKSLTMNINQDEAVAFGAAIEAARIKGCNAQELSNMSLTDISTFSLGVELRDGTMSVVLPKGSPIPVRREEKYPKEPNQKSVVVPVFEGEEELCLNNRHLGTFVLRNLPKTEEMEEITLTMTINADGILHVSGSCQNAGITEAITIDMRKGKKLEEKKRLLKEVWS